MDYNARNHPYFSKFPNFIPKSQSSNVTRSIQINNNLSACERGKLPIKTGNVLCKIDIDYVVSGPQLRVSIRNISDNKMANNFYINMGESKVIAISSNQFATGFPHERCSHQNANGPQCPSFSLEPSNFEWDILFNDLSSNGITQLTISGNYCCYSSAVVNSCKKIACASLSSQPIATFTIGNNQKLLSLRIS